MTITWDGLAETVTTAGPCVCCCPCRSVYGRPAYITLEFCILESRLSEIDDAELVPLVLSGWVPYASYALDTDGESETFCKYVLVWTSPNVKLREYPTTWLQGAPSGATYGADIITTPPSIGTYSSAPPNGVAVPDQRYVYEFADSMPRTAGVPDKTYLPTSPRTINPAYNGVGFEAVFLSLTYGADPVAAVVTYQGLLPPLADGTVYSQSGAGQGVAGNPFCTLWGASGSPLGLGYVKSQYTICAETRDGVGEPPATVTTYFVDVDTGLNTYYPVGADDDTSVITPASGSPVTVVKDIALRWRVGNYDEIPTPAPPVSPPPPPTTPPTLPPVSPVPPVPPVGPPVPPSPPGSQLSCSWPYEDGDTLTVTVADGDFAGTHVLQWGSGGTFGGSFTWDDTFPAFLLLDVYYDGSNWRLEWQTDTDSGLVYATAAACFPTTVTFPAVSGGTGTITFTGSR